MAHMTRQPEMSARLRSGKHINPHASFSARSALAMAFASLLAYCSSYSTRRSCVSYIWCMQQASHSFDLPLDNATPSIMKTQNTVSPPTTPLPPPFSESHAAPAPLPVQHSVALLCHAAPLRGCAVPHPHLPTAPVCACAKRSLCSHSHTERGDHKIDEQI